MWRLAQRSKLLLIGQVFRYLSLVEVKFNHRTQVDIPKESTSSKRSTINYKYSHHH
jgi:hypothetical protein